MVHFQCRVVVYSNSMKTQDATLEEINEALSYIVETMAHAENIGRKKALLELVDDLLDDRIEMQNK